MALRGKTPAYKKYRNLLEEKQSTKSHNVHPRTWKIVSFMLPVHSWHPEGFPGPGFPARQWDGCPTPSQGSSPVYPCPVLLLLPGATIKPRPPPWCSKSSGAIGICSLCLGNVTGQPTRQVLAPAGPAQEGWGEKKERGPTTSPTLGVIISPNPAQ